MDYNKLLPSISTDGFTIYEPNYREVIDSLPQLRKLQLCPKYYSAPIFVMWEMTGKCPLNCIHCYNESPRKTRDLSREDAIKLAEEIAGLHVFSVCMTGGEPTLRDDYLTIAGYFHQKRIPVSTITSGWTINETLAKEMCRLFSYIQVSIDGSEAEVHDYCRGRRGSFDRAINAIKLFKKHRANRLCVAYSCNKYNIEDFPRMVDLCLELGVDELKTQYLVMVGRAGENEGIEASEEDYQKVRQFIEKKQKELERDGLRLQVAWGNPVIHILLGIATSYVMVARITAEGYYSVSPYLPYVMGNVREKRLIDVWNNGLRRAWAIPTINRKIRGVSSVEDIHRIYKEYGAEYIDVLQKERHLQGDLTCQ